MIVWNYLDTKLLITLLDVAGTSEYSPLRRYQRASFDGAIVCATVGDRHCLDNEKDMVE